MSWFEWLGVIGSIASIIGMIPFCIYMVEKIKCIIIYNKLIKMDSRQLQDFFYKLNKNKRQLIKEQNSKLMDNIGKVKKGCINKAILNQSIINMRENQEKIEEEEEK